VGRHDKARAGAGGRGAGVGNVVTDVADANEENIAHFFLQTVYVVVRGAGLWTGSQAQLSVQTDGRGTETRRWSITVR